MLSKKNEISIYDLHGEDFIMYDAIIGKYSFELLSSLFVNSGVKPNFVQSVSQPSVFLGLVRASVGVALLASSSKENLPENVLFKKILLPEWVRADVFLATKKEPKNKLIPEVYNSIMEALYNAEKI